jgi:hypothetical protein
MPQVEAGASGVPIASVDYSAMNDIIVKLKAYPIQISQYFKELETKATRVYPDNNALIKILMEYIKMPKILQEQKRFETRKLTEKNYNWDDISHKWEEYLDNIKLTGLQGKWDTVLPSIQPIEKTELSDKDTAYQNIMKVVSQRMGGHQLASSVVLLNIIRDLNYGFTSSGLQTQPYETDQAINTINGVIQNHNLAMEALANQKNLNREDFIDYATMKERVSE